MSRLKALAPSLCLVVAFGCAKTVGSTYDPLAIFPAQATWAWDDAANRMPSDETLHVLNVDAVIRDTTAEGLSARGYAQAPAGSPAPYLLSYEVGIGRMISTTSASAVATLSLSLVESESKRRVWVGFIKVDVDTSLTEAQRRERLQAEMQELLEDFPPSQPK
jgi:hypothetical protein